ncbi:hypothetical protein NDU88_000874 [Pleurodeles waltl]|uniref:Uncharacterized protein n=1 Tax=Pleurodeles waltl TaxID=8319 RepID=A0AAV7U6T9_PLEWA|nr:hypothetical protein NDU88_000874 [Pleurodeles waltl]
MYTVRSACASGDYRRIRPEKRPCSHLTVKVRQGVDLSLRACLSDEALVLFVACMRVAGWLRDDEQGCQAGAKKRMSWGDSTGLTHSEINTAARVCRDLYAEVLTEQ